MTATWPGHELSALSGELEEMPNGDLLLTSEGRYLLTCTPPARLPSWRSVRAHREHEGILQFVNFIGTAELGGRRLHVRSRRLTEDEAARLLEEVVDRLATLAYAAGSATAFGYERGYADEEDVLHHEFVLIRQAIDGIGPHDLQAAVNRILRRPHRQLVGVTGERRLAEADRVDATSLVSVLAAPLEAVPRTSGLRDLLLVRQLQGRLPSRIRSSRTIETTDTRENAFVAEVLRLCADVVRRYAAAVEARGLEGSAAVVLQAQLVLDLIDRWRRHPVLATATVRRSRSVESAVLRRRPGYREVTTFFADLQSRTQFLDAQDAQRLLEARDAALLYEYWCFLEVVDAVAAATGAAPDLQIEQTAFSSHLVQGTASAVPLGSCKVWFNQQFEKRSYSVPLRPDIALQTPTGALHLFDAKFKHDPATWNEPDDGDDETRTYRRADLYKMHTYRDALDAATVWILYPGKGVGIQPYTAHDGSGGVGAIPLTPGIEEQRGALRQRVAELVGD